MRKLITVAVAYDSGSYTSPQLAGKADETMVNYYYMNAFVCLK